MRQAHFIYASSGQFICNASVADTFFTRLIGLQGRRELAPGAGMWILPTRSVHTFGMRFPIDTVALDGGLRVVGLCTELQPWRVAVFRAMPHSVLELPAGHIKQTGMRTGDLLSIVP